MCVCSHVGVFTCARADMHAHLYPGGRGVHVSWDVGVCLFIVCVQVVLAHDSLSLQPECARSAYLPYLPLMLMPGLAGQMLAVVNKAFWLLRPVFCKLLCQELPELRLRYKV